MSVATLRQKPPPMAGPFTAPMTGWCILRMARMTSSSSSMERWAIVVRVSPAMLGMTPASSRSAPEQNAPPAPVRTTTRVSLSSLASSSASRNGIITSNAMAFMRSGRFSVISVTCGRGLSTRTYPMAVSAPCRACRRCDGSLRASGKCCSTRPGPRPPASRPTPRRPRSATPRSTWPCAEPSPCTPVRGPRRRARRGA